MTCPMCADEVLQPYEHALGLHLDFCPTCRGIWFDRSELEYLLARALITPAPPGSAAAHPGASSPEVERQAPTPSTGRRSQVERQAHLRPMPTNGQQKQRWIDEMMDFFD